MKKFNKMDEMERRIQLQANEWSYRVVVLSLSVWIIYNSFQTIKNGVEYNIIPVLILSLSMAVQVFVRERLKHNMVAGDEEYKEENRPVRFIAILAVVAAIVVFIGTLFITRG